MNSEPLVKICGVTRLEQARQIAALGADFIGINLWPQSKRYLPLAKAVEWRDQLPSDVPLVAVMVNPSREEFSAARDAGLFSFIQLHGDETPAFCAALVAEGLSIIKAFQVRDEASLPRIADFALPDILLDAYHPHERGGLGATFPWDLALRFKDLFPERRLWLAGGLTPENVGDAARGVHPFALDVASGVEDDVPGVKNLEKVTQFIERAKGPGTTA